MSWLWFVPVAVLLAGLSVAVVLAHDVGSAASDLASQYQAWVSLRRRVAGLGAAVQALTEALEDGTRR